jgi:phage protein D
MPVASDVRKNLNLFVDGRGYWRAMDEAKQHEARVGQGEPVRRLKMHYPTKQMALAAARSELEKRERGAITLSLTMPGRTDLMAEGKLQLQDFRPDVSGEWIITRAEHTFTVEAEKPGSGEGKPEEDVAE